MSINYEILNKINNKDFYKNVYLPNINNFYNFVERNISDKSVIIPPSYKGTIDPKKLALHKKKIAEVYFTPILYFIYSYIYTKFYEKQEIHQMKLELRLNYNLYGYIFNHKNPIIKKINVFFHMQFKKELKNKENIEKYYIFDKINEEKENIVNFLEKINTQLETEEQVVKDKNKIYDTVIKNIYIFNDKLNQFITLINSPSVKQYIGSETNIFKILNKLYNPDNVITNYDDYHNKLEEINNLYLQLLKLQNNINLYIEDKKDLIDINKYSIDDVTVNFQNKYTVIFTDKKNEINIDFDNIIKFNDNTINTFDDIIEKYNIFQENKNINNKNNIKNIDKLLGLITKIYNDLKKEFDNLEHIDIFNVSNKIIKSLKLFYEILFISICIEFKYVKEIEKNKKCTSHCSSPILDDTLYIPLNCSLSSLDKDISSYNSFYSYTKSTDKLANKNIIDSLEKQIENIDDNIDELTYKNNNISKYDTKNDESKLRDKTQEIKDKTREIQIKTDELSKLKKSTENLSEFNTSIIKFNTKINSTKGLITKIDNDIDTLNKEINTLKTDIRQNETDVDNNKLEKKDLQKIVTNVSKTQAEINAAKNSIAILDDEIRVLEIVIQKNTKKIETIKNELRNLETTKKQYESTKNSLETNKSKKEKERRNKSKLQTENNKKFNEQSAKISEDIKKLNDDLIKLQEDLANIKKKLTKSNLKKELINKQKKILDTYNNQKIEIQKKIDNLKAKNSDKSANKKIENQTSYDYKKDLDTIFSNLKLLSEEIDDITKNIAYKDSINKVFYLYEEDTFIKKYDDISISIPKTKDNISEYFDNKLNNKNTVLVKKKYNKPHYFIKDLLNIYKKFDDSDKKDEIKVFFENLQKMESDLTYSANKYINLCDSEGLLILVKNKKNNDFIAKLDKQILDIINDVAKQHMSYSTVSTNNNKGKYIDILPYTDIIYMYFIKILLIIYKYPYP
jgi:protein-tyrosine phosphatase